MILGGRFNICPAAGLPPGKFIAANAGGEIVAVFNVDGEFYAISDTCSHAQASLSEGDLDGYQIMCPLHGAEFDVRSGKALTFPATSPVESFPIEVEDGVLIVSIP